VNQTRDTEAAVRGPAAYQYDAELPVASKMLTGLLATSEIQQLFESYYRLIKIPVAIIDLHANVLLSSRWQRICSQFHRVNAASCARCLECDTQMAGHLEKGQTHTIYPCLNGLTDCASPIVVDGQHIANLFVGQFLTQPPDEARFRRQAAEFGFDVDDYLAALREVPVVDAAGIPDILDLLARITRVITNLSVERKRALDDRVRNVVVMNSIPQPVFWKDSAGRYLGCNKPFAHMAGAASPEAIVGKTDFDLPWAHAEAVAFRADDLAVVSAGSARLHIVEPLRRADGERVVLETSKIPLRGADGVVRGVVGICEDITERIQAEAKLKQEMANLDAVFESSPIAMLILDETTKIVRANTAAVALTGGSGEAIYRRPGEALHCVHSAKDPKGCGYSPACPVCPLRNAVEGLLEKGGVVRGAEISLDLTHNGAVRKTWLEVGAEIINFNGRKHVCVALADITARKRALDELRRSEERFQLSMDATNDGVWDWSPQTGEVYYGPACYRMLGYEVGAFPGTLEAWQKLLHPDDAARTMEANMACVAGLTESFATEYRLRAANGEWRWILGRGKSITRDAQGRSTRLVGINADITEQKRTMDALAQSEENFRLLTEKSAVGVYVIQDGMLVYVNPNLAAAFGYAPEEIVGRLSLGDLIYPEDLPVVMRRFQERLAGKVEDTNKVYRALRKDGEIIHIEVYGSAVTFRGKPSVMGTLIDVTARKQAERELLEYKTHLEAMVAQRTEELALLNHLVFVSLDAAAVGAWWIDFKEDDTFHALDTSINLVGLSVSPSPNKAYRLSDWVQLMRDVQTSHPEYAGIIDGALEKFTGTISGKYEKYATVYPVIRPDGGVRWIDARADISPRSDDPTSLVMTGTVIDVTQLMTVEEELSAHKSRLEELVAQRTEELAQRNRELQQASERLTLAARAGRVGVWDWDVQLDDLVWDEQMYEIYGVRRADFAGAFAAWRETIHPDDRAFAEGEIQAALLGVREYAPEFRIVRPDGATRYLQAAAQTIRDAAGKPVRMIGVNIDVTERRQVENALRESEHDVLESQRAAHLGSYALDVATGMFRLSAMMEEVLGIDAAYDHSVAGWVNLIHPDERAEMLAYLQEHAIAQGRPVDKDFRIIRQNDQVTRWLHADGRVQRDGAGRPVLLRGTAQDVTERKHAEVEREALAEQLRVAQKMEAIGRLAGGVAHDFNNLLCVIQSYVGFALEDVAENGPLRADLLEVKKAGERAAALTRQLLAFSRKQVMQEVPVDLNEIALGLEKMLRRILGEDITLVQALAPELGAIRADPSQIEQVFLNLVVNARDAMPDGGTLTVTTANVAVDAALAAAHPALKPGPHVQVTIADTGIGMDGQTTARIFEPFFTTKEQGKGTGLGLPMVYGIIKQSGGEIWVESRPGQGTTFTLTFPCDPSGAGAVSVKYDAVPAQRRGDETVLIVEDEEALRNIAQRALASAGYTVLTAAGGDEAVDVAARYRSDIHLLLTDVIMPGMNGRVLAQKLSAPRPGLRVVYMSGYTDDAIAHHGVLEAGAHFLAKPFVPEALTQKVREVLDLGRAAADGGAGAGPAAAAPEPGEFEVLPPDVLARLREAVIAARYQEIVALAEDLRATHPGASARLRRMADDFDYEGLRRVVKR
jgi:PAS domain S-box-containing protein